MGLTIGRVGETSDGLREEKMQVDNLGMRLRLVSQEEEEGAVGRLERARILGGQQQ
jgi:hypothetical protein